MIDKRGFLAATFSNVAVDEIDSRIIATLGDHTPSPLAKPLPLINVEFETWLIATSQTEIRFFVGLAPSNYRHCEADPRLMSWQHELRPLVFDLTSGLRGKGRFMPEETFEFKKQLFRLWLNGRGREDAVAGNQLLVNYLRDVAHLNGTKTGCGGGECYEPRTISPGLPCRPEKLQAGLCAVQARHHAERPAQMTGPRSGCIEAEQAAILRDAVLRAAPEG